MKLYLDTADSRHWQLPPGCPRVQGVTTNPSLIRRAGLPVTLASYHRLLAAAIDQQLPELMLQLPDPDPGSAADWLDQLAPRAITGGIRLTIKLPCHPDWQALIPAVKARALPVLLTGLSNPMQLLWAREQQADVVAPYLGRLQAEGRDIESLIRACIALQEDGVKLLAASVKTADLLSRLIALGAHAVTLQPAFAASLATDPVTDAAIRAFAADITATARSDNRA